MGRCPACLSRLDADAAPPRCPECQQRLGWQDGRPVAVGDGASDPPAQPWADNGGARGTGNGDDAGGAHAPDDPHPRPEAEDLFARLRDEAAAAAEAPRPSAGARARAALRRLGDRTARRRAERDDDTFDPTPRHPSPAQHASASAPGPTDGAAPVPPRDRPPGAGARGVAGTASARGEGATRPADVAPRGRSGPPRGSAPPPRLPTAIASPGQAGLPWWRYQRPEVEPPVSRASARSRRPSAPPASVRDASSADEGSVASGARGEPEEPAPPAPAAADRGGDGFLFGALAVVVALVIMATASNVDRPGPARYLVPVFGLLVVAAVAPMLTRRHPEEPWLARFLVLGVVVKLAGSWLRYYTLTDQYDGVGDATKYHEDGSKVLLGIEELSDLRKTNFVRWFTSEVYSIIGIDFLAGFFVYGLLAFLGAYLWYRATAEAVPFLNRKLYCGLLFFAPSLMFWPSSIGKEALMMLGMGAFAVGVMNVLGHRILRGVAVGAAGGWLLWVVRPHLLALVTIAGAVAYFAGRKPVDPAMPIKTSLLRPIVMVAVAFATVFAVTQAADFLEMDDLSLQSIEAELAEQTGQSSQGGSKFENPEAKLTPLSVPQGMVTVLLRPFPWEVQSPLQILASLENAVLAALIFVRRRSVAQSLRRFRAAPFLLYCWTLMLAYSVAFASFANFGLLARQRSLVLPALYVLISLHLTREAEAPRAPDPAAVPDRPLVPV